MLMTPTPTGPVQQLTSYLGFASCNQHSHSGCDHHHVLGLAPIVAIRSA
jgi:hypothetical protein